MNRIILLLLCSLISTVAWSQSTTTENEKATIIASSNIFGYVPSLFLCARDYNIGIEIQKRPLKSWVFEGAFVYANESKAEGFLSPTVNTLGSKGFSFSVEKRNYRNNHKLSDLELILLPLHLFQLHSKELPYTGHYVSYEFFYQYLSIDRASFIPQSPYQVERHEAALYLNGGYQCEKKNGIIIDFQYGIGVKYQHNTSDQSPAALDDTTKRMGIPFNDGSGFLPSLQLKFNLGGVLSRNR